ncbi:hypothetical protein LV716_15370 [Flagellimonas sp. HMM57]|uniref:hypothetical protein n=1 Tax=unclassified Flagellimonas TaxID=2644544 RepID=UPI0013D61314|nr:MULTISPECIES: hypothetical protein [unclassified Flagellimonas]UII75624.1 hypothetical protein LV716_15370 [Flagellimonas sp. HMM57]
MKRFLRLFAIAAVTLGIYSCETETDVQETESLFETLEVETEVQGTDGQVSEVDDRQG